VEVLPDQNAMFTVRIPAVGVTIDDADLLASAAGVTVTLSGDGTRLVGADDQGRPYLYASNPILPGSTVSHWDPLARPSLLQEPNTSYDASHDLRMEVALLRDIGWTPFCGNGRLDPDEVCDDGAANSDTAPGACRTTCFKARCGDGVTDPGEACDDGTTNSNTTPGACRTTCVKPKCGDSVTDPGEQCDDGTTANSDTAPGACRTTCKRAACGDGVVDPGEACDDGPANGPSAACRPDCTKAPPPKKGCGCALGDGGASPGWTASLPALLALAALRRRRRRGASPR
jgi:MYXO-CTERM domain-containing protein